MKKYDIILWDVDGTLLDFGQSERHAISKSFAEFGWPVTEDIIRTYAAINDRFWKRLELGKLTKEEVLLGRFQELFAVFHIEDGDAGAFQTVYREALASIYFYQDDSRQLCEKLTKDYKQYIVTNGIAYTQTKKLRLSGFSEIMDGIFISEQIGHPKPRKEFFEACAAQIPGYLPDRTLIVGDSLTSDMRGGNNAGIAACWYNPAGIENDTEVTLDYEIRNLWELPEILSGEPDNGRR